MLRQLLRISVQNVGFAFVPFPERVAIGDEGYEEYAAQREDIDGAGGDGLCGGVTGVCVRGEIVVRMRFRGSGSWLLIGYVLVNRVCLGMV